MVAPNVYVVMFTGVTLVFFILVLLTLTIMLFGKVFESINKKDAVEQAQKPVAVQTVAKAINEPQIEKGISSEVVAAISAAIACMSEGTMQVCSVKRASAASDGRAAWSRAAVSSYTKPF